MSFVSARTSSRSISSTSGMSLAGAQMFGGSQARISSVYQGRTPSVYGGAGGMGIRISQASNVLGYGGVTSYGIDAVGGSEKSTMQNLNDRLASYLDKVRSLEAANRKLEIQIREFYEKRSPIARDFSAYFATINDLRAQIARRYAENQSIILQIDNAQLAADDFKMKYEVEMNTRAMVDSDLVRLRGVRDNMVVTISDLKMQLENLKDQLAQLKRNHEEEMKAARLQYNGNVNVEVDSASSVDLSKILQEVREQYESLALKNKQELERWYQTKMESLQSEIKGFTTEVKTFSSQLSELKRTYQSLEITYQGILAEIECLRQNLDETRMRYSSQLSQLQMTINSLEVELQQLKVSIEQQQTEYKLLLDIKMRLEREIAEYRRLLDGEAYEQKKPLVISKVVVEEHKPVVERRVKTIVENIVDGKVVSTSVDTQSRDY
ncbi:keratin, type I cytoskeletal 20-like [Corythoichthys intestinalis]|uniref:keratin, type I cytoskeletal 20-like n=1 Tax=Corythoichthys intestinalis TaxID=161448 RepID=UPI0025A4F8D0|nr:keratin, type I cytoskeletal 20-like [Corythoichthys intestinalis]XP_061791878.1 keratin, type I cytoskeletal 20-like [Nerophis lumbriciformis]